MKLLILISLFSLLSCRMKQEYEFEELKRRLSSHFNYSLITSEFSSFENCQRFTFNIEGEAKENLRIRDVQKTFLSAPLELPLSLNEVGLKRIKEKHLLELKTQGIKERCLEVKDFECIKYSFRSPSKDDIQKLMKKIEDDYSISLRQGERIQNRIQLEKCAQSPYAVSYL